MSFSLRQSANHPDDDSSVAGGSLSAVIIDDSSIGEWMPRLRGQTSGGLDTGSAQEYQYQLAYLLNTDSLSKSNIKVSIANWVNTSHGTDQLTFAPSNSVDGTDKFIRVWCKSDAGGLYTEDVALNGTTPVTMSGTVQASYRFELRQDSDGAQVDAVGDIEIYIIGSPNFEVGLITAGFSVATNEYRLAAPAAVGNLGTFANRRTEPAGLTWEYAYSEDGTGNLNSGGNLLDLPGPLPASSAVGVYCEQRARPGLGTADLKIDFKAYYEVGS